MPTILNDDLVWEWHFGNLPEKRTAEIAFTQYPAQKISAYTLAKDFLCYHDPVAQHVYEDLPALAL